MVLPLQNGSLIYNQTISLDMLLGCQFLPPPQTNLQQLPKSHSRCFPNLFRYLMSTQSFIQGFKSKPQYLRIAEVAAPPLQAPIRRSKS